MEQWESIRRRVLVENESKRKVMRETGLHWQTLEKILTYSSPPGYQAKQKRKQVKLGPYLERIHHMLEGDKDNPNKKQHHTAHKVFERLQAEGYQGGYTQVKVAVREYRKHRKEVYLPLVHRPGEAQVDFGYALVKEQGPLRKVVFFVMTLPHSDGMFVQVFERICTEVFWEGHLRAFNYFGGVPTRITYDNEKIMVREIIGKHRRKLTHGFLQLKSHYLFDAHFCCVRRANEKGVVEGTVRYARQNFLVPVPQVQSLAELNARLVACCRQDLQRKLRGKTATKGVLLEEDRAAFRALPASAFEACRKLSTTSTSTSLVRFMTNDYSVPVSCAHHNVVVKGYVDRVEIYCAHQQVACHRRRWGKQEVSYDPMHYLPLLQQKPGGLDYGLPFEQWDLPECFHILRRRLEREQDHEGTREFIRVLMLLMHHSLPKVAHAIECTLRHRGLNCEVVKQWLLPQRDWRSTTFNLDGRDHLRQVMVQQTDVRVYHALLLLGGAA